MSFNAKKCEFLRIKNKKNFIPYRYHINNDLIREVTSAKYLGVTIDNQLNWNNLILRMSLDDTSKHIPSEWFKSKLYVQIMQWQLGLYFASAPLYIQ